MMHGGIISTVFWDHYIPIQILAKPTEALVQEWGDNREGEEKKARRSSLAGKIHESLPHERNKGRRREMSTIL